MCAMGRMLCRNTKLLFANCIDKNLFPNLPVCSSAVYTLSSHKSSMDLVREASFCSGEAALYWISDVLVTFRSK